MEDDVDDPKEAPPPPYNEATQPPPSGTGYPTQQLHYGAAPEGYAPVPSCPPPPAYQQVQAPYPVMMGQLPPGSSAMLYGGPPGAASLHQPLMVPQDQQLAYYGQSQLMGQQPPTVVMVGYPASGMVKSYAGHIALSCLVFWFCGGLFGFIAFILAVTAQCMAATSPAAAQQYGKASLVLSAAGISIIVILTFILVVV